MAPAFPPPAIPPLGKSHQNIEDKPTDSTSSSHEEYTETIKSDVNEADNSGKPSFTEELHEALQYWAQFSDEDHLRSFFSERNREETLWNRFNDLRLLAVDLGHKNFALGRELLEARQVQRHCEAEHQHLLVVGNPPSAPPKTEVYKRLNTEKLEIRLLSIAPGTSSDDIHAQLITVSLNDNYAYEALSYTWGGPSDSLPITLDSKPFHVTLNLEAALRRLRLIDKERAIWVDAICINQNDVAERSSQVLLMKRIYSSCTRGIIWLGEEDKKTERAFGLIQLWSRDQCYIMWLSHSQDLQAVRRLIERPWWLRIWTVQETLLPPEKIVCCGGYSIPWESFVRASDSLQRHRWKTCCSELYSKDERYGKDILGRFHLTMDAFKATSGLNFLSIVSLFRGRKASDQRDKIFGLLSLSPAVEKDLTYPDYTADIQHVYTEFVVSHIHHHGSLQVLGHILDNQHAADLATWVPDWRIEMRDAILQTGRLERYNLFNACSGIKANISSYQWGENRVLQGDGAYVDTVNLVAEEKIDGKMKRYRIANILEQWRSTLDGAHTAKRDIRKAFWRTATLDTKFKNRLKTCSRASQSDIEGYGKWADKVLLRGNQLSEDRRMDSEGCKYEYENSSDEYESSSDEQKEEHHPFDYDPHKDTIDSIAFTLQSSTVRRRFFTTQSGYFGLGPAGMQINDEVYILCGGLCPLVLRKAKTVATFKPHNSSDPQKLHTLVGDCYVHRIMDGEFIRKDRGYMSPVYII